MAYKSTTTPGTRFVIDVGGTPLQLEGVTSLTPPPLSRPTSEWTPISSTAGKKYKTGRPAFGKASGECAVMPTDPSFVKLLALYNAAPSAAITGIEVALTDNGSQALRWSAFCDEFSLSFPNEGLIKARFGFQTTTGATAGTATAVTPNAAYDPIVSQGLVFAWWTGAAYTPVKGVENVELTGGARDSTPATPIDATAATMLPGYCGQTKLTFDLLYDSTETTTHGAMLTSAESLTPVTDKVKLTLSDSHTITLADINIDGFEFPSAPGTNRVKVSATVNVPIAIA